MNWRITQTDTEAGVVMLACDGLEWDNFPARAELLLAAWELVVIEREWGQTATAGCWNLKAVGCDSSMNTTAVAG